MTFAGVDAPGDAPGLIAPDIRVRPSFAVVVSTGRRSFPCAARIRTCPC